MDQLLFVDPTADRLRVVDFSTVLHDAVEFARRKLKVILDILFNSFSARPKLSL